MEASVYNPVIEHLCLNGETGKAENFFRQLMKTAVKDSAAFNSLVRGHSKDAQKASNMFRLFISSFFLSIGILALQNGSLIWLLTFLIFNN